jgi:hypothetical protein
MKNLKKIIRLVGLFIYMTLAVAGIALAGVPPNFTEKRRLFIDTEAKIELVEQKAEEDIGGEELKF